MRRLLRDSTCFWMQIKAFFRSQVKDEDWAQVEEAWFDGDIDVDVAKLQKQCPKFVQASDFSALQDLVTKKNKDQEHAATFKDSEAKKKLLDSKWEFFKAGLARDQEQILTLDRANKLLRKAHHENKRAWLTKQDGICGEAIKNWMTQHLQVFHVEKLEYPWGEQHMHMRTQCTPCSSQAMRAKRTPC